MTKIQTTLGLARPLDEAALKAISAATSIYGIHYVRLTPAMDRITVEYDASRLLPAQVPSALVRAGIPVLPE